MEDDVLRRKEVVSVTFDTTSCQKIKKDADNHLRLTDSLIGNDAWLIVCIFHER